MTCTRPKLMVINSLGDTSLFPCGRCMHCRIQRLNEWKTRLEHELQYHEESCFLTLTYKEEFLPVNGSLVKGDPTKFLKRFRKNLSVKIKYFYVGEYGEDSDRPHYHFIIFGWQPYDLYMTHYDGRRRYASRYVDKCWPFGMNNIGVVEEDSIGYVLGYVTKKLYGAMADQVYGNRLHPFAQMSKGLGLSYALDHEKDIREELHVKKRGKDLGLPRYYAKKLEIDSKLLLARTKDKNANKNLQLKELSDKEAINLIMEDRIQRDKNIKARYAQFERRKL